MRHYFQFLSLLAIGTIVGCGPNRVGDLVVVNANVWTGDVPQQAATAFAVRDGKFVYVGSDEQQARRSVSANARVLDAHGARILPGLIDAHLHLLSGGLQISRLNLRDVPDRAAFIAAVAERAKKTPKGQWILGGRWSTESWPDPAQPTKEWIDAATPDHPVLLSRMDGHALANRRPEIAGIDRNGPPDPPGGQIDRDPTTHEPTGILKDAEIEIVEKLIPSPSEREMREALVAAMKEANSHGLTCVDTMSEWRDLAPVDRARENDQLTLRVRWYVSEHDWPAYLDRVKAYKNDDMLRICGFKEYADGSLGSRTAYMAAPYFDNPPEKKEWLGLAREVLPPPCNTASAHGTSAAAQNSRFDRVFNSSLYKVCVTAHRAEFSGAVHAIGDQANHEVLDVYEEVKRHSSHCGNTIFLNGRGPARLRIEHAQHLLPSDIPRFAKLGVVASMQPLHKADDARYAEKAIGPERCKTSYAFRSLLDAGAHVAFGSDWPVVSLNPFLGIHAAVTGKSLDGKVFVPEQNITVEEALRCYTSGAAYASGDEDRLGKIKEGYLADFVVLNEDVLSIPLDSIKNLRVKQTYVGGMPTLLPRRALDRPSRWEW
jgi:predicted amidohydrolase YtcJ